MQPIDWCRRRYGRFEFFAAQNCGRSDAGIQSYGGM